MTQLSNGSLQDTAKEEEQVRIQITNGEQRFQATLAESPAARDLLAQLPVTVDMIDRAGVEKTGPLRSPLSVEGQPGGDQSYFPGIVILGRLESDAAQRGSELDGPVKTRVEAQDD